MRGGRGGRGRGRGRADDVAATASGPFSLGPAAQGAHKRMNLHDILNGFPTINCYALSSMF